ncbi:hypothetical protein LJC58_08355, partial [Lachnospiraceae bacterium OttesenSCG-928-D06]|nr:hypothetical protein [Lachnospiraceae bacterium OttesenSCG-928-D06]
MQVIDLNGIWEMRTPNGIKIPAIIPGSNYEAMLKEGIIEDPFFSLNEEKAARVARQDFEFIRKFSVSEELLSFPNVELTASGLDTLCTVYINKKKLAETDNIYHTFRWDVKNMLTAGENEIHIHIKNPFPYIDRKQKARALKSTSSVQGINHLRKPPYHFGWDWGPKLPPAGIIGDIHLEGYQQRVQDVLIRQQHRDGMVHLEIEVKPVAPGTVVSLIHANGNIQNEILENGRGTLTVSNPQLWWPNGLGEQPLYTLQVKLCGEEHLWKKRIGLRKIKLDTSPDEWGQRFRFVVNGVPIFAKGANWIPSDSFINHTSSSTLRHWIESAKRANMNMLRVWGGGYYESDDFYELCDENGILVWQDFIFACGAYPFYDAEFVEKVHKEVKDNVCRLRHHPCLALWCGNNENELFRLLWKKDKELLQSNSAFYYKTLAGWVKELDPETTYWAGSPSSGSPDYKAHDMNRGDSHLWHMWHGMSSVRGLKKYPTRFCSEYGIESLPGKRTIKSFTAEHEPELLSPEMKAHQKSARGNEKMLYYLLDYYRKPKGFENLIYLTQLVQARIMEEATTMWRHDLERHGGALYWQYNDCWPVASWSGLEYNGDYKALQYAAHHFYKPLSVSAEIGKRKIDIFLINEFPHIFEGIIKWKTYTFKGKKLDEGNINIRAEGFQSVKSTSLSYPQILSGNSKKETVLKLELWQKGNTIATCTYLLVPDRKANLPKPDVRIHANLESGILKIKLSSDVFARSLYVEAEEIIKPFSDNFFDLLPGEEKVITVSYDGSKIPDIKTKSVGGLIPAQSVLHEKFQRLRILCSKRSIKGW